MKHLILFLFCFVSIGVSAQSISYLDSKEDESRIMVQAKKQLREKGIDFKKAKMKDWETALKEIGKTTVSENILTCTVSEASHLVMTFQNGELTEVCERFERKEF